MKKGCTEKEMELNLAIISCDPSIYIYIYIMDHPKIIESYRKEESMATKSTMVKANRMPQKWRSMLTLHLLVSTKNSLDRDQAWRFSLTGPKTHWTWSGSKLKVFLIFLCYFSEKGHFEENQKATLWKVIQIYPACKDLFFMSWFLTFVMLCFNMWSQW